MRHQFVLGARDMVKAVAFAVVAAFIIKSSIVEAYGIPSGSMEDTLLVGDLIVSNKVIYGAKVPFTGYRLPAIRSPRPGDIITFKWPGDRQTDYVKRVVAVAGQTVEIHDKMLYIDGQIFPDPEFSKHVDSRILSSPKESRDNFGPFVVPAGTVFAMGDNRDRSYDSRYWGTVPLELIEGKVEMIQWSIAPDSAAPTIDLTDLGSIPKTVWHTVAHFVDRIRWERTVQVVE
jgi:signal peptidase I